MPQLFAFATATEILFGRGQAAMAAGRVAARGRRVLLIHGRDPPQRGAGSRSGRGGLFGRNLRRSA